MHGCLSDGNHYKYEYNSVDYLSASAVQCEEEVT